MNESTTIPAAQLTALIEERDALLLAQVEGGEAALHQYIEELEEERDALKAARLTAEDASSIEDAHNGLSDPWFFDGTTTQIIQGRLEAIAAKIRRNLEGGA